MGQEQSTLSGQVVDAKGRPVSCAIVMLPYPIDNRPIPGLHSATTDARGRFRIDKLPVSKSPDGNVQAIQIAVFHPDHPETTAEAKSLPADIVVTMPAGCAVTGTVTDTISGKPASGAFITARRVDVWNETHVATDAAWPVSHYGARRALRFHGRNEGSRLRRGDRPRMPCWRETRSAAVQSDRWWIHFRGQVVNTGAWTSRSPSPKVENQSQSDYSGRLSHQDSVISPASISDSGYGRSIHFACGPRGEPSVFRRPRTACAWPGTLETNQRSSCRKARRPPLTC